MNTYKKCGVVMLPTKDSANLESRIFCNSKNPNKLFNRKYNPGCDTLYPRFYYLYIISNEGEINEEDYWMYICPTNGIDFGKENSPIVKSNLSNSWFNKLHDRKNYYKIIATTDPELLLPVPESLDQYPFSYTQKKYPQIPQSFIDYYISEYNKGNKIEKVQVEYEVTYEELPRYSTFQEISFKENFKCFKITSDNTINIKSIDKNSWSREEVAELIHKFDRHSGGPDEEWTTQWIKENL